MNCGCSASIAALNAEIRALEAKNKELEDLIKKYEEINNNAVDIWEHASNISSNKLQNLNKSVKKVRLSGKSFDKNDLKTWVKGLSDDVVGCFYGISVVCLKYIREYNAEIEANNRSISSKRTSIASIKSTHNAYHVVHDDYSGGGGLKGKGRRGPR